MRSSRTVLVSLLLVLACGFLSSCAPDALVGVWERHGKQDGKPYTEHFALHADGTYSIEAVFDVTGVTLTAKNGTYTATQITLTLTDQDGEITTTPYALDVTGNELTIDNKPQSAWIRSQ
jgi:hypothetical protein